MPVQCRIMQLAGRRRLALGVSQRDLADHAGVSRSVVVKSDLTHRGAPAVERVLDDLESQRAAQVHVYTSTVVQRGTPVVAVVSRGMLSESAWRSAMFVARERVGDGQGVVFEDPSLGPYGPDAAIFIRGVLGWGPVKAAEWMETHCTTIVRAIAGTGPLAWSSPRVRELREFTRCLAGEWLTSDAAVSEGVVHRVLRGCPGLPDLDEYRKVALCWRIGLLLSSKGNP